MKFPRYIIAIFAVLFAFGALEAQAQLYQTNLSGPNESPPAGGQRR